MFNSLSFRTDYQSASAWGGQDDPVVEFMLCGKCFLMRESLRNWVSTQVDGWQCDPCSTRADEVHLLLDPDVVAELNDTNVQLAKLCACHLAGQYGWWLPGTEALVNAAAETLLD